jgi:hypothetical protein
VAINILIVCQAEATDLDVFSQSGLPFGKGGLMNVIGKVLRLAKLQIFKPLFQMVNSKGHVIYIVLECNLPMTLKYFIKLPR